MKRSIEEDGADNQKRVKTEESTPSRNVYIGSLHPSASAADICDLIQDGPLDQVRILPNKSCAFVSFLEDQAGIAAHARLSANPPVVYGKTTVIGWGAPRPLPDRVAQAVASGASRNVFIGGSVEKTNEEYLRESLSRFGQIDCVDMLPAKKIAFIHFAAITSAITCKEALQADAQWKDFRLSYGKDRCSPDAKGRPHGDNLNGGVRRPTFQPPPPLPVFTGNFAPPTGFAPPPANFGPPPTPAFSSGGAYGTPPGMPPVGGGLAGGGGGGMERTIYLGGMTEETNLKDVLDNVFGGMIDQIRFIPEKKCCFLSFVDPHAAQAFMASAQQTGFFVNDKPVKLGWGKSKPLPSTLIDSLRTGATRNVFLGNIDASITPEKLQNDLGKSGRTIEKIDILAAKKLAFIHFTSIQSAIQAVDELRTEGSPLHAEYATCRINFGRDRCATERLPRSHRPSTGRGPPREHYANSDAYAPKAYQPEGAYPYPPSTW